MTEQTGAKDITRWLDIVLWGDCLKVMPHFPVDSIDMVLTDPPQGITDAPWDKIIHTGIFWQQISAVVKQNAVVAILSNQPFVHTLMQTAVAGCPFRYDLIWRKNKPTGFLNAKRMPLRAHEHILIFYKKSPVYNPQMTEGHDPSHAATQTSHGELYGEKKGAVEYSGGSTVRYPTSVLDFPVVNNDSPDRIMPTQKPVELFEWLISTYTNPGDVVFDPFMGSGTTAVACMKQGRHYIGTEIRKEIFELAIKRIAKMFPTTYLF